MKLNENIFNKFILEIRNKYCCPVLGEALVRPFRISPCCSIPFALVVRCHWCVHFLFDRTWQRSLARQVCSIFNWKEKKLNSSSTIKAIYALKHISLLEIFSVWCFNNIRSKDMLRNIVEPNKHRYLNTNFLDRFFFSFFFLQIVFIENLTYNNTYLWIRTQYV